MNPIKRLLKEVKTNSELKVRLENNPVEVLEETLKNQPHPITHVRVFLIVVYIVGSALLASIIMASIMLWFKTNEVDQFFVMIASASIGALAGLLVPTPTPSQ